MFVLLAQEAGTTQPAAPQGAGAGGTVLFIVALGLIWWLLVFRPQSKAAKAQREKLAAIKKGDRVRTRGGIEGVVARVQDDKVVLRIDTEGKVHVPFAKAYIEDVLSAETVPETQETK